MAAWLLSGYSNIAYPMFHNTRENLELPARFIPHRHSTVARHLGRRPPSPSTASLKGDARATRPTPVHRPTLHPSPSKGDPQKTRPSPAHRPALPPIPPGPLPDDFRRFAISQRALGFFRRVWGSSPPFWKDGHITTTFSPNLYTVGLSRVGETS